MNLGISFSGYWCGPYTLFPRVMITGRLKDLNGDPELKDNTSNRNEEEIVDRMVIAEGAVKCFLSSNQREYTLLCAGGL